MFDVGVICVDIDLEEGGVCLIWICDDGGGIVFEELLLVVFWYVISKIVSLDDFEVVVMLGFCGEVLLLIVLVSCFILFL